MNWPLCLLRLSHHLSPHVTELRDVTLWEALCSPCRFGSWSPPTSSFILRAPLEMVLCPHIHRQKLSSEGSPLPMSLCAGASVQTWLRSFWLHVEGGSVPRSCYTEKVTQSHMPRQEGSLVLWSWWVKTLHRDFYTSIKQSHIEYKAKRKLYYTLCIKK